MENNKWNRRDIIKSLGLTAIGVPLVANVSTSQEENKIIFQKNKNENKLDRPVTAIVIGAGNRGWGAYSSYGLKLPEELQVVGVAEPIPYRRERMAKAFNIPKKNQFVTWEDVFEVPKFADALIIATPDNLHYGPAMAGLQMGYDMLLEKVIAQSWKECNDILKLAEKTNAIVAICHVLRYAPYFRKMKEVIDSGEIGEVVSIQHIEAVERIHMAHSFVRGNWRNSKESNPIILSKMCHDTDILRWLINKPCKKVSSFGSLTLFREENASEGSTLRCTDGCAIERQCPYSAIKVYKEDRVWLSQLILEEVNDETILRELRNGPYGRCVYHCDNDVVDHQVVNFEFENQITASLSLAALANKGGRFTRVYGTEGNLSGNMETLTVSNAKTGKQEDWTVNKKDIESSGHGGGDHRLVHDFVRAISFKNPSLLTSTIQASMESHLMGFQAEASRLNNGVVKIIGI